jgi:hypothetical protein
MQDEAKLKAQEARRAFQLQLKSSDTELLETVTLLKKTQHSKSFRMPACIWRIFLFSSIDQQERNLQFLVQRD